MNKETMVMLLTKTRTKVGEGVDQAGNRRIKMNTGELLLGKKTINGQEYYLTNTDILLDRYLKPMGAILNGQVYDINGAANALNLNNQNSGGLGGGLNNSNNIMLGDNSNTSFNNVSLSDNDGGSINLNTGLSGSSNDITLSDDSNAVNLSNMEGDKVKPTEADKETVEAEVATIPVTMRAKGSEIKPFMFRGLKLESMMIREYFKYIILEGIEIMDYKVTEVDAEKLVERMKEFSDGSELILPMLKLDSAVSKSDVYVENINKGRYVVISKPNYTKLCKLMVAGDLLPVVNFVKENNLTDVDSYLTDMFNEFSMLTIASKVNVKGSLCDVYEQLEHHFDKVMIGDERTRHLRIWDIMKVRLSTMFSDEDLLDIHTSIDTKHLFKLPNTRGYINLGSNADTEGMDNSGITAITSEFMPKLFESLDSVMTTNMMYHICLDNIEYLATRNVFNTITLKML